MCDREVERSNFEVLTLGEPFRDETVAHLTCVIERCENWIRRHPNENERKNPWRASLPTIVLEKIGKEMKEEASEKACYVCGKPVYDFERSYSYLATPLGKKRVHGRCVIEKCKEWLRNHIEDAEQDNPWFVALPVLVTADRLKREIREERVYEKPKNVGRCRYCHEFVIDKIPYAYEFYKGRRRAVHNDCVKGRIRFLDEWVACNERR